MRTMVVGSRISYNWSNPQSRSGAIQEIAGTTDALALFNKIFVAPTGPAAPDPNAPLRPIADRVLADYNRLRNSNTRLSANDRTRLDDHVQRISELQRRLQALPAGAQCGNVHKLTTDTNSIRNQSSYQITPSLMMQVYQAFNDVIVAAFMCDSSRIAVANIDEDFSSYVGDWHQDVAHHAVDPDGAKQAVISAAHQATFAGVFLDLCNKLDVDDGSGADLPRQRARRCGRTSRARSRTPARACRSSPPAARAASSRPATTATIATRRSSSTTAAIPAAR